MNRTFANFLLGFLCFTCLAVGEPVDWIFTARFVVTMDAQKRVIEDGAVAVRGAKIVAVGARREIERGYQAKQRLDQGDGVIVPGLINTHTHAAMSLFRGIADDLRLQDWLEHFIFPAEARNVTPDFVRWGTRLGCLEMLLSGTTTFTDMYYFEEEVAEAVRESGMRGVLGQTIIRFPVADARTPEDELKRTGRFLEKYSGDALVIPAVAPHALYTNSRETLAACRKLAGRFDAPLLIHLSETKRENDDSETTFHMSPTQALASWGILDGRTLVAHAVWTGESDFRILAQHGTGIAHCPSSNMKLASGIAPVARMLELGLNVGLGTDGPAGSNNDFDLMEEMDLAAKLQKVATGNPQAVPASEALEMATIRGARALGLGDKIGSLEPGKLADLITIGLDVPNAVPLYDVDSQIVYALKASDVRNVMVNGKLVVRNRKVLTLDVAQVMAKAREYGARVKASLLSATGAH